MKIKVTQRHIDMGVKCSRCACPVALAIREQYDDGMLVTVNPECVTVETPYDDAVDMDVEYDYVHLRGNLPHEVADFIRKFDQPIKQTGLHPFEFELELK